MPTGHIRRPRRTPLTPEEVAEIIALKERQAHFRLQKFKKTRFYKAMNIFNIACIFVYLELLFCFYGPCVYRQYQAETLQPRFGQLYNENGTELVRDIDVLTDDGQLYNFVVNDYIDVPPEETSFYIGEDFLLRKKLKGVFDDEEVSYRLFAASPILFLAVLVMAASFIAFIYNLNENAYSLSAISVLNALTFLGILTL